MSDTTSSRDPLRRLLGLVRRRWLSILSCVLLALVVAGVISAVSPRSYEASASLLFRDPGFDQRIFGDSAAPSIDPTREAATNLALTSLETVSAETAKRLDDGTTAAQIADSVSTSAEGQSDVVSVTATAASPRRAAALANEFAAAYVNFRQRADRRSIADARQLVETELEQIESDDGTDSDGGTEARRLQEQLSDLQTLEALQTGDAEVVQEAMPPASPANTPLLVSLALGVLLGGALGLVLAGLRERFDARIRDSQEISEILEVPTLGTIPKSPRLDRTRDVDHDVLSRGAAEGESFRLLRTRLRYFGQPIRSLVVTSSGPAEGKSTVAYYLAASAAEAGTSTVLIEADFHAPTLASERGFAPLPGLSELLSGQSALDGALQQVSPADAEIDTVAEKLGVITAGETPPNPLALLEADRLQALFTTLAESYELIVVDTPPAAIVADTLPLIQQVNGVLVVGSVGVTQRPALQALSSGLRTGGATVLGVVLNRGSAATAYAYGYTVRSPKSR